MLLLQSEQFNFVGFMLSFLLQPTSSRGQFVLLLARFRSNVKRQLAHRRHVVDDASQLVQLLSNCIELLCIWRQIVAITFAGLTAMLYLNGLE